ncbi:MAG: hypothetical protein LBE36_06285 [Flavobacteriaceae bacterium]|nr:hypothetical protein [Flavobacteriaceae bacterium]
MYDNEKDVAQKAERMLQTSLRSQAASSFKEHILKTNKGKKRLRDAVVKATVRKYANRLDGVSNAGKETFYLNEIKVKMNKAGFVQHYGVDNVREGHWRQQQKTSYFVKPHNFKMRATPWIDGAIQRSDVLNFISTEVAKIRMKNVVIYIKNSLEQGKI